MNVVKLQSSDRAFMNGYFEIRGFPPIRQRAGEWVGHPSFVERTPFICGRNLPWRVKLPRRRIMLLQQNFRQSSETQGNFHRYDVVSAREALF